MRNGGWGWSKAVPTWRLESAEKACKHHCDFSHRVKSGIEQRGADAHSLHWMCITHIHSGSGTARNLHKWLCAICMCITRIYFCFDQDLSPATSLPLLLYQFILKRASFAWPGIGCCEKMTNMWLLIGFTWEIFLVAHFDRYIALICFDLDEEEWRCADLCAHIGNAANPHHSLCLCRVWCLSVRVSWGKDCT